MTPIAWDGKPISKPGLYTGIPIYRYHERIDREAGEVLNPLCVAPSISSSGLRTIWSESPADYWWYSPYNPQGETQEDKEHFVLGSALHHLALGEEHFHKFYVVPPPKLAGEPWSGRRKVCQEWLRDARLAGKSVLSHTQVNHLRHMLRTLKNDRAYTAGLLGGLVECSLIAKDPVTGFYIKSRPDSIPTDSADFADLKSTSSLQTQDLMRTILEFGYHQQAALVRTAARAVLNIDMQTYVLLFVQNKPPYCSRELQLRPEQIDRGEQQNRVALDTFAYCLSNNVWPGPGADRPFAEYISLPDWALNRIDERLAEYAVEQQRRRIG